MPTSPSVPEDLLLKYSDEPTDSLVVMLHDGSGRPPLDRMAMKEVLRRREVANALLEEETLSIARKALRNSERATWRSTSAIVLSIIMAIHELIKWYSNR